MSRKLLFYSAAVFSVLSFAAPALAQSTNAVSEVLVTAERRTQSVQKSSLAISVVSPEALKQAGVTQARDLTKIDPGVQIGQGGPATQVYIRGVGDFGSTPITNPAVATNVDGVYVSRSQSIEGNFFDLERIEVVKGPQGTLYGRNASGGALNIITNKPKLGQFGGDAEIEVGNFALVRTEAAVNIPLGDNFAVRGAMQVVSRDGYAPQGFDDDHHEGFRFSALWKPDDRLSVRATVDYEHVGGNGPSYAWKGPLDPTVAAGVAALGVTPPVNPRTNGTDPAAGRLLLAVAATAGGCLPNALLQTAASASGPITPTFYQGFCPAGFTSLVAPASLADARQNNKFTNFSAEVNYDLGFATLTVLPAYRKVRNDYTTFPLTTYDNAYAHPEKSDTYSFEARLGDVSDVLTWVAGVYYFKENQDASSGGGRNPPWPLLGDQEARSRFVTESRAVFGQATYGLTDRLRVIGGLRYSKDDRMAEGDVRVFANSFGAFSYSVAGPCYLKASPCTTDFFKGDKSFDSWGGKAGVEFDLAEQNMLFLTYATAEKAGGFNQSSVFGTANQAAFYGPERVKAWEFGSRNRFFDSRLQANFELFHWKYDDSQQTFSYTNSAGGPAFGYTNAGSATMYGASADITARLTPVDTFRIGVEYLHSNFDSFIFASGGLTPATTSCKIIPTSVGQNIDCSGKPLIRAPEYSGSTSYTHTFELANGGAIDATWSSQFATERWLGVDYIPALKAAGYWVNDVVVAYHNPENSWSLSAYVRNLGDELVYTGSFAVPALIPSYVVANLGPPRTWGARLSLKF